MPLKQQHITGLSKGLVKYNSRAISPLTRRMGYSVVTKALGGALVSNYTRMGYLSNFRRMAASASLTKLLKKEPPEFLHVPFVKEDLAKVMEEVPDFQFYHIGKSDAGRNVYSKIPLTDGIYVDGSEGKYSTPDSSVKFSKLENGLRIAAIDRGGCDSLLGLYVYAGSRFESFDELGVSSMLENMAFFSSAHLSHLRTIKTVEALGANVSCHALREHFCYQAECLRTDVPILLNLLIGNVLFPRFLPWELKDNSHRLDEKRDSLFENTDSLVTEELHSVAWHNNTLGLPNYVPKANVEMYNPDLLRNYMLKHFSPDKMVIVGINVDSEELNKWTARAFADYETIPPTKRKVEKPTYTGGVKFIPTSNTPLLHLAVAYQIPGGGWSTPELIVFSVLQSLLGGGGSFSTGGPGKGMHSRLFLSVLNQHEWVESCMAFNTAYSDAGLFGLYIVANPTCAGDAVQVLKTQFQQMKNVTDKELERAKNSLKSFLWMSLEHKSLQMEDVARQLLLCNKYLTPTELEAAIDQVGLQDVKNAASSLAGIKPSIVAAGNVNHIPSQEHLLQTFTL